MSPRGASGRTVRLLSLAFAVAAILAGLQVLLQNLGGSAGDDGDDDDRRFVISVEELSDIASFEIESGARVLSFERGDERDFVIRLDEGAVPVRRERLHAFLNVLLELDTDERVTGNPERHDALGVSEGTAFRRGYDYRVELDRTDGGHFEFLAGIPAGSTALNFRRTGEDAVYRSSDTISFYLDQTPLYWAEMRLFAGALSVAEIESVEISDLVYETAERRLSGEGDRNAIQRLLSLEAGGLLDRSRLTTESREARYTLSVRTAEARYVVVIGEREGELYPASIIRGEDRLTPVTRGTLALRADLFERFLNEVDLPGS